MHTTAKCICDSKVVTDDHKLQNCFCTQVIAFTVKKIL